MAAPAKSEKCVFHDDFAEDIKAIENRSRDTGEKVARMDVKITMMVDSINKLIDSLEKVRDKTTRQTGQIAQSEGKRSAIEYVVPIGLTFVGLMISFAGLIVAIGVFGIRILGMVGD